MDNINFNRLTYFVAVVDTGSFTKAGERLGVAKTVVSQQVSRLEDELKTTLLHRTTRRVEPTEAGRNLHARCVVILREAVDAVEEVIEANASPQGVLRITAPNDYGAGTIAPLAAEFTRKYPDCTTELILSDEKIDLIANQIDLSIRIGWLEDSSYQARRIDDFHQLVVAAPDVVAGLQLREPEDLKPLPFIANSSLREPLVWHFTQGDFDRRAVKMRQQICTNSTPAIAEAVLAGGGIAVLPDFLAREHVASGALVQLLPDWDLPIGGIHAVYPADRFRPSKVAAFVDMMIAKTRTAAKTNNKR